MITFEATVNTKNKDNISVPMLCVSRLSTNSFQLSVVAEMVTKEQLLDALQETIELLEGSF
jgi:hypothetical protein